MLAEAERSLNCSNEGNVLTKLENIYLLVVMPVQMASFSESFN